MAWYAQNLSEPGKAASQEFYSTDFPRAAYRDLPEIDTDYLPSDPKDRKAELDRIGMNKVQGRNVETRLLMDEADERLALSDGWRLTVAPLDEDVPVKRGPGRPPRSLEA